MGNRRPLYDRSPPPETDDGHNVFDIAFGVHQSPFAASNDGMLIKALEEEDNTFLQSFTVDAFSPLPANNANESVSYKSFLTISKSNLPISPSIQRGRYPRSKRLKKIDTVSLTESISNTNTAEPLSSTASSTSPGISSLLENYVS
jgi:hypothetical protein